jgi:hypothetical protein
VHVIGIDPAIDAGSEGEARPDDVVGTGPKGETRLLGAILFYPRDIDENMGESYETTVERSNWGIIRLHQLR